MEALNDASGLTALYRCMLTSHMRLIRSDRALGRSDNIEAREAAMMKFITANIDRSRLMELSTFMERVGESEIAAYLQRCFDVRGEPAAQ